MNKRTTEAVEWAQDEARDAEDVYEDRKASHLRHLAEVVEKAEALIANFNSERGHDGNDWLALDALVNAEEVERT